MASQQEPLRTPEEYLAFERAAESKHEYLDGRIYAMSGTTRNHVRVTMNVGALLHGQLRGRPCEPFGSDLRVRVPQTGLYTYPDVSVVCGGARFDDDRFDVLLNPTVLVEVLSPTTESYDRGEKFAHYRRIPTLQEYVLFAQDRVHVERFARTGADGDQWLLTVIDDPARALELPSIGCTLGLGEVYERVELPPVPPLRAVYERTEMPSVPA